MHSSSGNLAISASDVPNSRASSVMRTAPTAPIVPLTPPTHSHARSRASRFPPWRPVSLQAVVVNAQTWTVASPPPVAKMQDSGVPCTAHTPCLFVRLGGVRRSKRGREKGGASERARFESSFLARFMRNTAGFGAPHLLQSECSVL